MIPAWMLLASRLLLAQAALPALDEPRHRRRQAAAARRFVEAMAPGYMVLGAEVWGGKVRPVVLFFSPGHRPTVALGRLRYHLRRSYAAGGRCAGGELLVDHAFEVVTVGDRIPVVRPPPLPLGARCAGAGWLYLEASFQPSAGGLPLRDHLVVLRSYPVHPVHPVRQGRPPRVVRPRTPSCGSGDRLCKAVEDAVSGGFEELQRCYERQLLRDQRLGGRVVLDWTITAGGRAVGIRARSTVIRSPELLRCLAGVVRAWRFSVHRRWRVRYPLVFEQVGH
jgi:hypothetical protein